MEEKSYNIVCVLRSGGDFTWEHVRNLGRCVVEHTSINLNFFCLIDKFPPEEFRNCARYILLKHNWPGWWAKIELFRVFQNALYLDLDTFIVGNIDPIITFNHTFSALQDFGRENSERLSLASGVMGWGGDCSFIYENFLRDTKKFISRFRGDQDFIRTQVEHWEPFQWIFPEQVVSYKIHCQDGLPEKAKIVCFHGKPRIHEVYEDWMPQKGYIYI